MVSNDGRCRAITADESRRLPITLAPTDPLPSASTCIDRSTTDKPNPSGVGARCAGL